MNTVVSAVTAASPDLKASPQARQAPELPPAVDADIHRLTKPVDPLAYYAGGPSEPAETRPLLLLHSINAAGSVYELKPIFEHYVKQRPVYALDFPGFGFSDRSDREYSPRLMTDAIHALVETIQQTHGSTPIDALALSLGSEFLARAATENPGAFNSLAFVCPTGFDRRGPYTGKPGSHRGMPLMYSLFRFPLWTKGFFDLLTTRPSVRFFLNKSWGSKDIDEGMLEYDLLTTRQPGARHAPYYFVSGYLFSKDISDIYASLQHPVWMAHGIRGDFIDYRHKNRVEDKPNWQVQAFSTGALPHFEMPEAFAEAYDQFLTNLPARNAA